MADINVERKRRSVWPLLLALLLVAAVAAGAWWYMNSEDRDDADTAAEVQGAPEATPYPGTTGETTYPAASPPTDTMPATTTGY